MNYVKDRISVVICTYNHSEFIRQTIESIQQQEINDFEIIIADDCSTDGAISIIKEMAIQDSRIIPLFSDTNRGISNNFNKGLRNVTGEFIATLGGDDLM